MNALPAAEAWAHQVANEYRRRLHLVELLRTDADARAITLNFLAQDRPEAVVAFARDFCITHDPRNTGDQPRKIPFIPWPRQVELLHMLWECEQAKDNLVVEKSRDTGVTVLAVGVYYVWRWLFFDGWVGGVGSRKMQLLDRKDDPNTVFSKVRRSLYSLPSWMLPAGFDPHRHDNHTRLFNPARESSIIGEAGEDQGRGGRSSLYVLDEWGKMPRPNEVEAAVSGNADCVAYISTATPVGTHFHELVTSGRARVFRFHWTADPRKDQAWYDKWAQKYGPLITALEVDINYGGASDQAFIPYHYVQAAVLALDGVAIDATWPSVAGFDVAGGGSAEHVYVHRMGPMLMHLHGWSGDDPTQACEVVSGYLAKDQCKRIFFDSIGVGAGVGTTLDGITGAAGHRVMADGVNVGAAPDHGYLPDNDEATCKDRFANLKAQLWWQLRARFESTFRRVMLGESVPVEDCISIPEDPALISQLVAPRMVTSANGKVAVESKDALARRGVASPDRAEAVVLAFCERPQPGHTIEVLGRQQSVMERHRQNQQNLHRSNRGQRGF